MNCGDGLPFQGIPGLPLALALQVTPSTIMLSAAHLDTCPAPLRRFPLQPWAETCCLLLLLLLLLLAAAGCWPQSFPFLSLGLLLTYLPRSRPLPFRSLGPRLIRILVPIEREIYLVAAVLGHCHNIETLLSSLAHSA